MIDAMFQPGTDAALDDQLQRVTPRPAPKVPFRMADLAKSPFQGIGSGVAGSMAFASEILGAFGQVAGAYPEVLGPTQLTDEQRQQANRQRDKLATQGIDYSNEIGDTFRARAKDIMPDPQTTHASAQVVAGLTEFATKAVGYGVAGGPVLGAAATGADVGMAEADRLKQAGVDPATRTKAGAAAGVLAGGSMLVPMTGATALSRFAKGVFAGEVGTVGTALAEKKILEAAGYDKIADQFDPFDPVGLALGVIPGALGAKFGRPKLRTEADVRAAAQLTPAEQARSDAFERSSANLAELEQAIKAEKNPQARALLEAELAKQRDAAATAVTERAVQAEPDLVPAARVRQTADALESTRLTPDGDLAGAEAHLSAVELAGDQMARGESVAVFDVLNESARRIESLNDFMARPDTLRDQPLPPDVKDRGFIGWLVERGGVAMAEKFDITGERGGVQGNPGGVFRKTGQSLDVLAQAAERDGYLPPGAVLSEVDNGGTRALAELIRRAASGERVLTLSEQMAKRARDAAESDMQSRLNRVSRRLESLGVDVTPARGNVAALEAYERQHRPALLAAAFDEARAAMTEKQVDADYAALQREARQIVEDMQDGGRTVSQYEAEIRPLSPVMRRMVNEIVTQGEKAHVEGSALSQAAREVAAMNPDMLVHMEGMDGAVPASELLARVREEAALDATDSKLLQVAAACALRN